MRRELILSATHPNESVSLEGWRAAKCVLYNATGSPVYVRQGGRDIPTASNAEFTIPGASVQTIPLIGAEFAFAFADTAAVTAGPAAVTALSNRAYIFILSVGEEMGTFGALNFASLSLASVPGSPFPLAGASTTTGALDLSIWGGLLAEINSGGNAVVTYWTGATNDFALAQQVTSYAALAGQPLLLTLPRIGRYGWIVVAPWTGALSGTLAVRFALSEVLGATPTYGQATIQALVVGATSNATLSLPLHGVPAAEFLIRVSGGVFASESITWTFTQQGLAIPVEAETVLTPAFVQRSFLVQGESIDINIVNPTGASKTYFILPSPLTIPLPQTRLLVQRVSGRDALVMTGGFLAVAANTWTYLGFPLPMTWIRSVALGSDSAAPPFLLRFGLKATTVAPPSFFPIVSYSDRQHNWSAEFTDGWEISNTREPFVLCTAASNMSFQITGWN